MKKFLIFIIILNLGFISNANAGKYIPSWKDVGGFPDLIEAFGMSRLKNMESPMKSEFNNIQKKAPLPLFDNILSIEECDSYIEDGNQIYTFDLVWDFDRCSVMKEDGNEVDIEEYLEDLFYLLGASEDKTFTMLVSYFPQTGNIVKLHNRLKNKEFIRTVTLFPDGKMQLSERDEKYSLFETIYENSIQILDR